MHSPFPSTQRRLFLAALVLAASFLPARSPRADDAPAIDEPARRLLEQSRALAGTGRLDDAIAAADKALAIQREMPGDQRGQLADTLEWLAGLQEQRKDLAAARTARQEALAIRRELHGPTHWRTTHARLGLERLDLLENLDPEQQAQLDKAAQSQGEAMRRYHAGQYHQASEAVQQVLAIHRAIHGEEHPDYVATLLLQAVLYERAGDHAKAEPISRQACDLSLKIFGEDHPTYASALNNLALLYHAMGAYAKAEPLYQQALQIRSAALGADHPEHAASLNNLARLYAAMGKFARAEPLYQQALEIRRNVLGESHPEFATALSNLGLLYYSMGAYTAAEPLYRQSAAILAESLGEEHPSYAISLNMLAGLYQAIGDYAHAEPLLRQAVDIAAKSLGRAHPDYATFLNNLAFLYQTAGAYARAEPLFQEALRISSERVGQMHPESARALANLAALYDAVGDYERAEPLSRRALEIRKNTLGTEHPEYAASLHALAELYMRMGEYDSAQPLGRQASEVWRVALGEQHPHHATGIDLRARLYEATGDHAQAEPLYEQALEIRTAALGDRHADRAASLNNLAGLYLATGRYAEAEPLFQSAAAILAETLGQDHPRHAAGLTNLASLHLATGEYARAEPLLRRGLEILDRHRDATFAVQNERQRLALVHMLRGTLDGWLSAASRTDVPDDQIYNRVLRWKGVVFARQREERLALERPELEPLVQQLRSVRSRWATLAVATPEASQREQWRQQVAQLQNRKEQLESELARRSGEYRQAGELDQLTAGELARRLPPQTAFVEFLQYTDFTHQNGRLQNEVRLWAFVMRPGQPPIRVELGPAEPVEEAVDRWRDAFGHAGSRRAAPDAGVQRGLADRIWQPLAAHVSGADALLIAPDGALCRFPLAALPGQEPDSYLIEQFAVGYVTSGRHLAELLEERPPAATGGLLLAGGIDYTAGAAEPGAAAPPLAISLLAAPIDARTRSGFEPLPGTELEVQTIAKTARESGAAGDVLILSGAAPTEDRIKKEFASGRWRYVHLATHGFFAPPIELSPPGGIAGRDLLSSGEAGLRQPRVSNPQLLSGLVLAGAARAETSRGEDGILTAAELENLNLRGTELVVLSACQTGLGAVAGGEGMLGLQRAFHLAAAETLIASLWRVDDAATSLLMETFYRNLWEERLSRLEALRQAQLFVLNHPEQVEARRKTFAQQLLVRGLDLAAVKALPSGRLPAEERPPRSPPALWAAFLLSGQWR